MQRQNHKRPLQLLLASFAFFAAHATAKEPYSLHDLAFLEGAWKGGEDFIFEETWNSAEGGVMTGMARGVSSGDLRVLEYIVVTQEEDAVVMRFKHFNGDYSTWENDGPVVLILTDAKENDATFTADPPSETVKSIRYSMPDEDTLQVDVALVENGEDDSFTLELERAH